MIITSEYNIRLLTQVIGDYDLLCQPDDKAVQPGEAVVYRFIGRAVSYLVCYFMISDDRPGDKLGKQDDIGLVIPEFIKRSVYLTVHIHNISNCFEGIKRYADW